MDAEMAEDWLRCVFLKFAYKCCKLQRTCKKNVSDPWLLSVEIAVRITG